MLIDRPNIREGSFIANATVARGTTVQRNAVSSPNTAELFFNTTTGLLDVFNVGAWAPVNSSTLNTHINDATLHLSVAQKTFVGALDFSAETPNAKGASLNALSSHLANTAVHISAAQNTLLDGLLPALTSTEVNQLIGVTGGVQSQLNAITSTQGTASSNYSSHIADNTRHLTAVGTVGTYSSVTTDLNGRVIAGTNPTWNQNTTGNAATSTLATTAAVALLLVTPGGSGIYSNTAPGTSYTNAVCIREANAAGAQGSAEAAAPRLGFHWGGVVASSIMLEASGRMAIRNNPGTAYEALAVGSLFSSGDVTAFSDIRVKTDIQLIFNSLAKVQQIRGVTYARSDIDEGGLRHTGVIAQEVEEVIPEAVHTDTEGMKSVAYGNLVGLLIEAIKELNTELSHMKAEIKVLKEQQ